MRTPSAGVAHVDALFWHSGCVSEIPSNSGKRAARLASLPLGMAGKAARSLGRRALGRGEGEWTEEMLDSAAEQVFAVLGELKGGAMKVGQALSVFEASVPEKYAKPFRESLAKLQAEAPPLPSQTVKTVLDQQLGTAWPDRFESLNLNAVKAASIGQVHRGVWSDGREVAVKIQYPGADQALLSDLRQIRRVAPLLRPLSPGTDIKGIVDELSETTAAELDYRAEADHQRRFHAAYADHPTIGVPAVLGSSPKVIISEWVEGTPLTTIIASGTPEQRHRAAELLTEFQFSSPTLVGAMHSDPHPGNFFLTEDDTLVVLDFGAVIDLETGFPSVLEEMMGLALADRAEELVALMRDAGYIHARASMTPQEAMLWLDPFIEPLRSETFNFSRAWMQDIAAVYSDVTGPQFKLDRSFALPRDYVLIHRILSGSVGILCQLDTELPYRDVVRRWMPRIFEIADSA